MKLKYTVLGTLAISSMFLLINNSITQAATNSVPAQGNTYIKKGTHYNLHLKIAGKVVVTTKANYKIVNTANWTCIPYPTKQKHTKIFYLRAGNYTITTNNATSIKTSYTKLVKLRKSLDSFVNSSYRDKPNKITINKTYKSLNDMFHPEKYRGNHIYRFKIDKPKKLTMTMSSMPVYKEARNKSIISIAPQSKFNYPRSYWNFKGVASNKKHTWYLTQGVYNLEIVGARGRYSFKLKNTNTDKVPTKNKITNLAVTDKGLQVDYSKVASATSYMIYAMGTDMKYTPDTADLITEQVNSVDKLSQTIPANRLMNGRTYKIATRSIDGNIYSDISDPKNYTYYVPLTGEKKAPVAPTIKVSYDDDNGNDESAIRVNWNSVTNADSYQVSYRLKGSKKWTSFLTKSSTGDEIYDSSDKKDLSYFVKGKTYEVRVCALHSNLKGDWSKTKTVTITRTPDWKLEQ